MTRFDVLPPILWNLGGVLQNAFYMVFAIIGTLYLLTVLMRIMFFMLFMLNLVIRFMFSMIYAFKCCGFFKSHPVDFSSKRMLSFYRYGILRFIQMHKLHHHRQGEKQGKNEKCSPSDICVPRVQRSVVVSRVFESRIIRFLHLCVRSVLIAGIVFYRGAIRSSLWGSCRFYPSCSAYAIQALRQHGLFSAVILMTWRIIRCNPWGQCGHDPVPSSLFSSS